MNLRDSHRWLAGLVLVLLTAVAGTSVQAGWVPAVGSPRVLVLLINFNNTTTTYSPAELNQRIFGLGVGSVRDYFLDVSYGQLDLQGDVYSWYPASQSHDYYSPGTYGRWAYKYPENMYRLAEEAVDAAHAAGVDFSLYDNDADGEADAIIILHQGEGGEINGHSNDIWTTIDMISRGGGQARAYDGVIVDAFMIAPEISPWGGIFNIGPIAHEFGHLMGMIDSYDYDASSNGVGVYDLMCRGVWGVDPGVYTPDQPPAHPSPWQKVQMGWITPTLVTPATQGLQSVPAFETNPVVWKVPANPDDNREYFLLANLTRTGNHALLPSEGLSIWHVDDRALFQNERESRGCTSIFPRLALEQADGYFDLEDKVNWGDTTDLYPGGGAYRSFEGSTTPSSKNYACYLSGVAVENISDPAAMMTAEVWLDRYVSGLSAPDLKIKSYQVIPVTGDGDWYFEPGERFQLALTLVNDGATATGVTATLNPAGWYTVNQNTSSFPNLAPGGTAGGAPALDSTIKSDILSAYNNSRFYWYLSLKANAGAYSKTAYIYFRIGHPALLYVDDDGGQFVDNYLKTGLDYYLYFYDTWEVAQKGAPAAADLSNYARVLWATGADRPEPLSPAEQSALAGYLDAGGQLLLSSPYLLVNPSAETLTFAQNYLHVAGHFDDRYAVERIQGITNDPISHSSLSFYYLLGWPYFPLHNRTVGLVPGAGAAGSVYNDYSHFTVIRYPEPYVSGPRVIFLAYALESSYNKANLPFLLRRYLNGFSYQTGEPFVWDINPGSGQLKQLNELLTITGINFQPSTTFAFPLGGITITNQQYISDRQFQITIRIAYNARYDYHTLAAQNPSGPSIVLDKYFRVVGPMLPNQKPVANAGPDKAGYRSDSFTLEGSGSDPDYDYPIRYKWTRVQGASVTLLPGDTAAQPSFTPNPSYAGKYIFSLTVYDALNLASDADTVTVTVWNLPPSANAGPDQADYRGSPLVLDGSGSSDPEGDPLTFQWTQLEGATVTLVPGNTAVAPSFDPARAGNYLFSLVVFDGYDLSPGDTVRITVLNQPPVADAGPDQTDEVLKRITFDAGLSADPDNDPLEYQWVQYQGMPVTLNTDDPVHPYFDAPQVGTYRFGLRVFDGYDWSLNEDMVLAEVTPHFNHAPVAIAGPDRQGYRADSFLLDGSGSYDPDAEPITYQWSQLQGPAVTLLPGGTAEMPTFSPDPSYIGLYLFSLVVNDGWTLSSGDTVQVQVLNHLPVAAVGPDQVAVIATLVTLDGSGSSDLDGDTLSYQWTQTSGPAATLNTSDPVRPTFQPDTVGNYVFDLRVNDGFDDSLNADAVEIIIKTLGNQLPVPVPGPDQIVSFYDPAPVPLDGTASYDPDGTILGYAWELESRPAGSAATLSDPSSPQPTFDDDVPGIYLLSLRVRDNEVWSFKAYTTVTSDANRDSDGDTVIDYLDPDDDNDQMPDAWETANGLNAYDPSDGGLDLNPLTDPDSDGLANLNEFFNESDPQQPDLTCYPAGCFFLDADGNQIIGVPDKNKLSLYLNGRNPSYSQVVPPNGDTQDLDGNGILGVPDLNCYSIILNGRKSPCSGYPGPMTLLEPAGSSPSVQVGATLRITAETHALNLGNPRPGLAVVFEVISGSGIFFGGDGETPPRRTLAEHSALNSISRESAFSISRDGLEIFFASNQAGGLGGYDIYRAVRGSVNEPFGPPVNLNEVNTAADETGPSISADRLTLYFASGTVATDFNLFTATRPAWDQSFGAPQPITELNTSQWQLHPMPSDDQLRLYFVQWINSTWNYNLLLAERPSLGSPFGSPAWLANLNTAYNESFPFLTSDELTIIFSSDRPAAKAGWNLWMATRTDIANGFGNLVELYRVNTSGDEWDAHLSSDGLRLTLSSSGYAGPGETDLWEVTRASTALPFYVTDNPGRFDITGPIQSGSGQNSSGRAVLRFQPTAPGLVEIVVSSPADPRRYIPSSAVETIIQVQVP